MGRDERTRTTPPASPGNRHDAGHDHATTAVDRSLGRHDVHRHGGSRHWVLRRTNPPEVSARPIRLMSSGHPCSSNCPIKSPARSTINWHRTLDILPTIADILGVDVPWRLERPLAARTTADPGPGTCDAMEDRRARVGRPVQHRGHQSRISPGFWRRRRVTPPAIRGFASTAPGRSPISSVVTSTRSTVPSEPDRRSRWRTSHVSTMSIPPRSSRPGSSVNGTSTGSATSDEHSGLRQRCHRRGDEVGRGRRRERVVGESAATPLRAGPQRRSRALRDHRHTRHRPACAPAQA